MRVLVTGASGFIGGWIARALHERGNSVRAVYRREAAPPGLRELEEAGAETLRLDLTSRSGAAEAARGMDAVVHAAARTGDWGEPRHFREQNYELTARVLEAAAGSGARTFVYIGSIAVHGFGVHRGTTEAGPYYPHVHPYQVTKKMAEDLVLSRNGAGLKSCVIRPGIVYGPGDTTTFYPLLDAQRRGVRGTLGGGHTLTCPVYIEDLVEAVILALRSERSGGEVFNITGGELVTWRELLDLAAELQGVRPWVDPPLALSRAAAAALGAVYRALRIPATATSPPVTRYRVEQLAHDFYFDIAKARSLLGFTPRVGWREGIERTVDAYLKSRAPRAAPAPRRSSRGQPRSSMSTRQG